MANYAILKAAIQDVIKTNGNKEITGQLLQNALIAMINSLGAGYQFAGVAVPATNPGTPDYNVFYFAGPGTYPNFNNATIPARNVGLLSYNGTWNVSSVQTTPFSAESIVNDIIQLYDGATPVYPRTRAEAVFFDNDTTKTLDQQFSQLGQEVNGNVTPKSWYQGIILGTTGKYSSSSLRVTNAEAVDGGTSKVRVICSGDVRMNAISRYKIGYSPVNGGTIDIDFTNAALPSTQSRVDVTFDADASFPNIYITFARISNSSADLDIATVAANVQFIWQDNLSKRMLEAEGKIEVLEQEVANIPDVETAPQLGSNKVVTSNGIALNTLSKNYPQVIVGRKNLFNPAASQSGKYIDSTGNYVDAGSFSCAEVIPVEPDTDYHLSAVIPGNNDAPVGNANSYGIFYNQDGTLSVFSTNSTSVHTPDNCYALEFSYINASSYTNLQLEKGTQRTEYESFIPSDLSSLMDNVPTIGSGNLVKSNGIALKMLSDIFPQVNIKRNNLFNKAEIKDGYYIKSDGTYAASGSFACSEIIPVAPNTDYYLSNGNNAAVGNVNSYGIFYKNDGTKVLFNTGSKDVHTPVDCYAIEFSYIKSYEATVQFEKGTSRSTYESFRSGDIDTLLESFKDYFITNYPSLILDSESILPRQLFVIKGEQNSLYHSEYCKNYDDNAIYADKSGGSFAYNKRCWRVEASDNISGNLQFALRYRKTDAGNKSFNVPVRVGLKTNTTNNIKVNIIGDSFCYGGHYIKQVADCCDNADFVGMRKTQYYPTLFCEGRGGWSLASYFNPISSDVTLTHMQPFSPFMHASGYNYYGVIEFWAAIVNGTSQYSYGTGGFDNYTSWFGTDGRKLNPSENDLMYNTTAGKYEYWDGSAWQQLATAPEFAFDYSKYISIWGIDSPDFVVIQLGTNDFFSGNANMTEWFERMDAVVASIKAYATAIGKTINILICTVLTASGTPNNTYKNGIIKRNHYYYDARKAVIEHFDPEVNYTNNKVTVVDTGVSVDDEYGFLTDDVLPFAYYEGDARELYDTNGVHPDIAGYKQFGNPIAGAIQYLRS